jgi:APA family basic amino acid/polyamine antiporter
MGTHVAFAIVAFGVLVLRHRQPELKRPFKCPGVPYVSVLCIGACAFLILYLKPIAHLMFLIWHCIGLLVYFVYGVRNSENRKLSQIEDPVPVPCHINPESPLPHVTDIDMHKIVMAEPDK